MLGNPVFNGKMPLEDLMNKFLVIKCNKSNYFVLAKRLKNADDQEIHTFLITLAKFENDVESPSHDLTTLRKFFLLGLIYHYGLAVPANVEKAYGYLKQAICINEPQVRKEIKSLLSDLKKDAHEGNLEAIFDMANMYERGLGVKQDYKMAAELYQRAADQEYPDAIFKLGVMYSFGNGVQRDCCKAAKYFRKAYESGKLSERYHPFLRAEAMQLLEKNDDPEANYNLAVFLKDKYALNKLAEQHPQKFKESCQYEIERVVPMLHPDLAREMFAEDAEAMALVSEKQATKDNALSKIKKSLFGKFKKVVSNKT